MGLVSSVWVLRTEAYEGLGVGVGAEAGLCEALSSHEVGEACGWHVGNGRVKWAGLPMIVHPRGVWMASWCLSSLETVWRCVWAWAQSLPISMRVGQFSLGGNFSAKWDKPGIERTSCGDGTSFRASGMWLV